MHQEQRERTHALLKSKSIHRALFANPANVTWLTGFARPWRAGADLYAGGPPLVWYEDGHFTLIVMDGQVAEAEAFSQEAGCAVIGYAGYAYEKAPQGHTLLKAALRQLVEASGNTGTVGVEARYLPFALAEVVRSSTSDLIDIDEWLTPYRLVRTDEELDKMRENFALIKIGQEAAKATVKPGNSEMDVWFAIHNAMQTAAGQTLHLGNDCVVGRRMGGPALDIEILPTDSFIVDLSTILHGYWSDGCVTYYATEPSSKQVAMHRTVADALELAISLARPGAIAREIDQTVRQFVMDAGYPSYPHHTGHGAGVIGHEGPRITPHSEEILEAGMVIMLEPGIYYPGETGVRLEHAVLVTDNGPEIISPYDLNIP